VRDPLADPAPMVPEITIGSPFAVKPQTIPTSQPPRRLITTIAIQCVELPAMLQAEFEETARRERAL
jgi:hypothetical protein